MRLTLTSLDFFSGLRIIARKEREIADEALRYEQEQQAIVTRLKPEVSASYYS